ncbi:hypothetical protein [Sediminibacterium sp.]|uniref:hypothetical protein n=1 Tax=Sediminibacterium sp. TaxID=1917865 RepID=UPI0027323D0B|nr:hypothetical protein [Sediminibacterium sp.]MDP3393870.1 hypothetical protein [Sediminibacterium sp.]MDP3568800.1 hypothetical protein [Sediminibacterium sp.]
MYYNHNLRTNLQEWKNRLAKSGSDQFPHQLKYFISNIEGNKILRGILDEAVTKYTYTPEMFEEYLNRLETGDIYGMSYENEPHHAAHVYQFLKFLVSEGEYELHMSTLFYGQSFADSQNNVIETLITPITYYFHDQLEKSSSIIYLLEKYKRRTEWFTRETLQAKYSDAQKNYEQLLEDDLRMFLFDQGIDYPFSTPKSTSGRADLIGAIDTNDPLILEIKLVDKERNYGKNRVCDGFTQIVRYTNDYNKDAGYLAIFNFSPQDIVFSFANSNQFPPMLVYNNKSYFFLVINLFDHASASKQGKIETMTVTEEDLIKQSAE